MLLDSINLAADLGAEVVWLKASDVVQAILDFAHDKRITRIMVGRTRPGLFSHLFDRSTMRRLIDKARDFDVQVVSDGDGGGGKMSNTAKVVSFPGRAREGLMVCLSSNASGAEILLRKASKAAAELDANWYAVHVDTTLGDKNGAPDSGFRALLDSVVLGRRSRCRGGMAQGPGRYRGAACLRPRRTGDADYRRSCPPWPGRAPAPSFGNRRTDRARARVRNRSGRLRQAREKRLRSVPSPTILCWCESQDITKCNSNFVQSEMPRPLRA